MHRLLLIAFGCACLLTASLVHADAARLAQLVDYVGVDYAVAVQDGEVISELEYEEMQEFATLIADEVSALPAGETKAQLAALSGELAQAVEAKADPGEVARIADRMTALVLDLPALATAPAAVPDLEAATSLYAQACATCHGASGRGDGPAAADLPPPEPTDFTDRERAEARSLYGLYNTITLGVEGTSMAPFGQLTEQQRWALAFYVGSLHADDAQLSKGAEVFAETPSFERPALGDVTTSTLAGVAAERGDGTAAMYAWLRANPAALAERSTDDPLIAAMSGIRRSVDLYAAGEAAAALDAAVDAYLEGFELAEAALSATQPDLVLETETAMIALRQAIRDARPEAAVRAAGEEALRLLETARDSRSESLSPAVTFVSALIILLREGLEAILVLGAMAAFLRQTGRREAMAWLHGGWMAALAVGVLTWVVSNYVIAISGATREVTEGVTALVAAAVLFYVGFWMHSKLSARRWQQFIQNSVQQALDRRGLWALAGIAFIAVYREVFEIVLFYQALWAQTTAAAAESAMLGGFALGAVLIVAAAWAIFRFGVRLPLRQFFAVTAAVMIALAVIFAGKGVAALQEAGKLPIDPIDIPRIELLGIYPTVQSLAVQLVVLAAAAALIALNRRSPRPARA